jgi:DNA-binding MarR family transcriptional regulator
MAEGLPPRDSDLWLDWTHFLRAYKVVLERISNDLSDTKLPTLIEYSVLYGLFHADGNRSRLVDLSKNVLVSKSRVTRLVQHMVDRGWVRREESAADKRVTFAVLTEGGREAFEATTPAFIDGFQRYFADQLKGNEGQLTRVLRRMATQVDPMPYPYDRDDD